MSIQKAIVRPAPGFQDARRTQSPTRSRLATGCTKSEARSRARELLATGQSATWKTSDGFCSAGRVAEGPFTEKQLHAGCVEADVRYGGTRLSLCRHTWLAAGCTGVISLTL